MVALTVWLAWQIVTSAAARSATPEIALLLAPQASVSLTRAAAAKATDENWLEAATLARRALSVQPFNVVAIRTLALAETAQGDRNAGLHLMAVATSWTLRDSIAHLWMFEERLRRGELAAAVYHVDTLGRRRPDAGSTVGRVMLQLASRLPGAAPVVADRLAQRPAWRPYVFAPERANDGFSGIRSQLAILLHRTAPLDEHEQKALFTGLIVDSDWGAVSRVRQVYAPDAPLLTDGRFSPEAHPSLPFGWTLIPGPGWAVARSDQGLVVSYDSFAGGHGAEQVLMLEPGNYFLRWRSMPAPDADTMALSWKIYCLTERPAVLTERVLQEGSPDVHTASFSIGADCPAQRLVLAGNRGERRRDFNIVIRGISLMASSLSAER